jgi:rRNA maturation endonuclease Nob1
MKATREIIWHFVCQQCSGWFSIAVMDHWKPKKLYCPHCGKQQEIVTLNN